MKKRNLLSHLLKMATYYPVVLVDGPRQAGKTTLCRGAFPDKAYVSLESLDNREFATSDPRGFLSEYGQGVIIDEIQNAPELVSYLQDNLDEDQTPGRFILTGSQNLAIFETVSQSLAGRVGILHLLPLSQEEIARFPQNIDNLFTLLWTGSYPRIYDRQIPAHQWLADYVSTYIQRDVRQLLKVGDLNQFTTFLKLCAAHTSQELNLSSLGGDAGISHNTANTWLSVLEASFLCFRLPAWHANIKKQIVKAPKLHFFDSGLVCYLLGIREPDQLKLHPLRGAIFETWVASEYYKKRVHQGTTPSLFHFRESRGIEVDLIEADGDTMRLVEAKSGETISRDFFGGLNKLEQILKSTNAAETIEKYLVYGGATSSTRNGIKVISWQSVSKQV